MWNFKYLDVWTWWNKICLRDKDIRCILVLAGCRMGIFGMIKFFTVKTYLFWYSVSFASKHKSMSKSMKIKWIYVNLQHARLWWAIRVPPLGAADPLRVSVLGVLPLVRPTSVGVHPNLREHEVLIIFLGFIIVYLETLGKLFASFPNKWRLNFVFNQSKKRFYKLNYKILLCRDVENLTRKCHRPWSIPPSCFFPSLYSVQCTQYTSKSLSTEK